MLENSYNKLTSTSIDMTDCNNIDNSPMTSSASGNDIAASTSTPTRTPPNLVSDWSSADSASGGWIEHGMGDDDDQDSDDPAEQEQFDRISGILSQLILEANNAINSTSSPSSVPGLQAATPTMTEFDDDDYDDDYDHDYESDSLEENTTIMEGDDVDHVDWSISTIDSIISETVNDFSNMDETTPVRSTSPLPLYEPHTMMERTVSTSIPQRRSRLPRPKKLSLETLDYSYRNRSSSMMSTSTSSSSNMDYDDDTLFSPVSSDMTTPMSRTISPLLFEKGLHTQLLQQGSITETELALLCDRAVQNQRDNDNDEEYASPLQDNNDSLVSPSGSLLASFERLDSSLAIVDSLSRDLANYRRQHPRHSNSTSIHPMTTTTLLSTNTILDTSTNPTVETTKTTTSIPSHSNQQYTSRNRKWITILLLCPILYIPYLLVAALWEQISIATGTITTTTAPLSLLLSTASAMMFDDRHTFASLKNTFITTITSTTLIGNGNGMIPPCIGLAVFFLFLAILYLLKGEGVAMDQASNDDDCQFMDTSSYDGRSKKMIRQSSLPMVPCSPCLSRRNSF